MKPLVAPECHFFEVPVAQCAPAYSQGHVKPLYVTFYGLVNMCPFTQNTAWKGRSIGVAEGVTGVIIQEEPQDLAL